MPVASQCIPVHPGASRCIPGIGHWTSVAIFYMHEVDVYVPPIRTLTVLCIYVYNCIYITVTVYSSFYHDIRVCVCVCFLFLSSFGPRSKPFRIRGTLAILSFRMLKFWCVEWSQFFLLVNLGSYPLWLNYWYVMIAYHIISSCHEDYSIIQSCGVSLQTEHMQRKGITIVAWVGWKFVFSVPKMPGDAAATKRWFAVWLAQKPKWKDGDANNHGAKMEGPTPHESIFLSPHGKASSSLVSVVRRGRGL